MLLKECNSKYIHTWIYQGYMKKTHASMTRPQDEPHLRVKLEHKTGNKSTNPLDLLYPIKDTKSTQLQQTCGIFLY